MKKTARHIELKGLVQGVGFRPFVYRLAHRFNLNGTVENNNRGVDIWVEGEPADITGFMKALPSSIPEASSITELREAVASPRGYEAFSILSSTSDSSEITEVSPDIGVCSACLEDMKVQPNRIDYPFTNCTNCGPRFTIIRDLPYDRQRTTMEPFIMCEQCSREYSTILDRRFHAQPVACNNCGPHYVMHNNGSKTSALSDILREISLLLREGRIVAMKGLGGYHLACNPFAEETVSELRRRKTREGKPFALMFKDIGAVKEYQIVSEAEAQLITGWRKPIVLLRNRKPLAPSIGIGLTSTGVMLPYMPFHHLLFEHLDLPAIVLTSGNLSDEPIITDDREALERLGQVSDAVLTYNRSIHNRTDDSVAMLAAGRPRIIRRSRSYAPSPIPVTPLVEGIFAGGAELVNCFAIGKGRQAILSQHIGDLQNLETLEFYTESIERHKRLFRFTPEMAVMDMHPDYLSSRYVQQMGIPLVEVQHHHAHIAACMTENGLDEPVIGISFDGTGYGTDGNSWGGEFMVCDLQDFQRIHHFEYVPQPGGDLVTRHPWRMMLAYLQHYFGRAVTDIHSILFEGIDRQEMEVVQTMLEKGLNSPLTSSVGRLFDAVSALMGICRHSSYHAEAPMRLEAIADQTVNQSYPYTPGGQISMKPAFTAMMEDLHKGSKLSLIAGKFHNTIVDIIVDTALSIAESTSIKQVVLSGGSFQNRILMEKAIKGLRDRGLTAHTHSLVPSNDGGIALGQLAIGGRRRELGMIS